jgi:hypothetical protein
MSEWDYTKEEIKNFPLDLRICFHILGWNKSFKPKDAKEWANDFAYFIYRKNEYDDNEKLKIEAYEEYEKLYSFIKELLKEQYNRDAVDSCGCMREEE